MEDNRINKVFKHQSGNLYVLIGISNLKAIKNGYNQEAFYIDQKMQTWSRPIKEFMEKFEETKERPWIVIKKI